MNKTSPVSQRTVEEIINDVMLLSKMDLAMYEKSYEALFEDKEVYHIKDWYEAVIKFTQFNQNQSVIRYLASFN